MKVANFMVDYSAIQTFLRALDAYIRITPGDDSAVSLRQMVIEAGAAMEINTVLDMLLEADSSEKHGCENCDHKEECHPAKLN